LHWLTSYFIAYHALECVKKFFELFIVLNLFNLDFEFVTKEPLCWHNIFSVLFGSCRTH
jgi:hypothetical protein